MSDKYCINCKHFSPKEGDIEYQYPRCSYGEKVSLVTSRFQRHALPYCENSRSPVGDCKPEGLLYEEATNV